MPQEKNDPAPDFTHESALNYLLDRIESLRGPGRKEEGGTKVNDVLRSRRYLMDMSNLFTAQDQVTRWLEKQGESDGESDDG